LVACTGNAGCKFAAANTKLHAERIATHLESRIALDAPVNIHLTGCHHSCAQHYVGDIGLIAAKIEIGEVAHEGYHLFVGGGAGAERGLAREVARDVLADALPAKIEALLATYLARRQVGESFHAWANRQEIEVLRGAMMAEREMAA
jgi:ferredoxin-nitrite reductase